MKNTMKIAAHRGYSGLYPENTMLAFEKAKESGADEIELDVQLSKDGVVVVFHDESIDRLTGKTGMIRDFSFDELGKLNAGRAVFGEKFGLTPIPSLDEYFSWVKTTDIVTNIELKNSRFYYEGLEEKTLALIARHGLAEQVFFSSFNHASLIKCKQLNPAIKCGVLTGQAIGNAGHYVKSCGLDFYHPNMASLDAATVADCERCGVSVNVWTVNDMAGLLQAREWNLRGVITNFPDVCAKFVRAGGGV